MPGVNRVIKGTYPADWDELSKKAKEAAGNRCERCGHPDEKPWKTAHHNVSQVFDAGEFFSDRPLTKTKWRCKRCKQELISLSDEYGACFYGEPASCNENCTHEQNAKQRMLTVHHLDGNRGNCADWNLAALCQACHLSIQGRFNPFQDYLFEHSDWMKPHVEGRDQAMAAGVWP